MGGLHPPEGRGRDALLLYQIVVFVIIYSIIEEQLGAVGRMTKCLRRRTVRPCSFVSSLCLLASSICAHISVATQCLRLEQAVQLFVALVHGAGGGVAAVRGCLTFVRYPLLASAQHRAVFDVAAP